MPGAPRRLPGGASMSGWRKLLGWLKDHERPISAGVALLGFSVGALSMLVALFQAALLYSQRATPYRAAIYVRQLEVAENLVGAAIEQHIRIINLRNDCQHRISGAVGAPGDYAVLAQDFRSGAQALHIAYSATLASYPPEVHARARQIVDVHERLFDRIVAPSADCHGFMLRYDTFDGAGDTGRLYALTGELVNSLRTDMGVEALSWPPPVREAVRAAEAPKPD
jgi:hypothetical protein